jgi:preprotein translocase subunit SecA
MFSHALRPGATLGPYPEREAKEPRWLDQTGQRALGILRRARGRTTLQGDQFIALVSTASKKLERLHDAAFKQQIALLREQLSRHGLAPEPAARTFALVRELAARKLGQRPYDTQIRAGWIILRGMLAEMETGEGKTLAATLPACAAALAGIPVHVVTANDYLVKRDAAMMSPLYSAMGLSVGTITNTDSDADARRNAYACHITYCTSQQLAFDYLRDRLSFGSRRGRVALQVGKVNPGSQQHGLRPLLRGLCFAIVDEADSVLIDEARTPLILSQPMATDQRPEHYGAALHLAACLREGIDFRLAPQIRQAELTTSGKSRLAELASSLGATWTSARNREAWVRQALCAQKLYSRNHDYLVRDGKVQIIDQNTGRAMPDRSWELGLHQLIEVKEGCELTDPKATVARISYQRFFRRYLRLAGMTGTAREVLHELRTVYDLEVVRVPTHKPSRRTALPDQVLAKATDKWRTVVARLEELHQQGRPVLVGTRSVAASNYLTHLLGKAKLPHAVLNASQDEQEAQTIAGAGQPGRITVATNMAGRGTDIRLATGVAACGGLHVIATERNEARRIDRQLFGRCARQGDPGSFEAILSLEDELLRVYLPASITRTAACLKASWSALPVEFLMRLAQRRAERQHARLRRQLLKLDAQLGELLAFSGPLE